MVRRALNPFVPDRGSHFTGLSAISTTQSIASGVSRGYTVGAAIGQVAIPIPGIGAAVGALVGAVAGWADAAFNRKDAEDVNFQQAMAMSQQNGPESVLNIGNKYLVLAGLFDLTPNQIKGNIPIYKKYGHMGEQRFVTDMMNLVYSAAQSGQIGPNDTAQSVFSRIVQPWINSFGFGPMSDSNSEMITYILMGMLAEYFVGLQTRWHAIGGDYPFGGLPPFSLPQAALPQGPTSSPTPSPVYQPAAPTQSSGTASAQLTELQRYLGGALPRVGDTVGYTRDGNGQFMAVPAGATFVDVSSLPPVGAWILHYSDGNYVLVNGVLTPIGARSVAPLQPVAPVQPIAQPAPATPLGPPAGTPKITLTTDPGLVQIPANYGVSMQPQPYPSGGGSYLAPSPAPSQVLSQAAPTGVLGLTTEELMLGIGGVVLLVILLKKRKASV
jgi:hypothetical protein